MAVDPFSEPISKLSDLVLYVARTTSNFKPQLSQLKNTLDRITPIIVDIRNQNRTKSEQDMFIEEIKNAQELVNKCLNIKWNPYKRFMHSLKLKDVDQKLLRFFQIEVQAVQCRDIQKTLEEVNYVNEAITSLALDVRHFGQTSDSVSAPVSSKREHERCGTVERKKFGWQVPPIPRGIVGFEEPLITLKAMILSDTKAVVVSAAGGFGKTTLVKMLANDPQIQDVFRENVFFVTVSETPNFMVSVNDLFNPNCFDHQVTFQGCEDAKNKLENFLREKVSGPILLVLDDVWSDSYIKNFEFDIKGYKLLVTTRMRFTKYDEFKFEPLSDEDAKILFRRSARPTSTIDENLVDEMVACCKKHPLTLSVVGSSLDGKNEIVWKSMLKSLSQGQSVLDLNQEVLHRLERSFESLEDKFKQCFIDFGLFLEDQSIPARVLLDMWVHLYNHDDEGVDTLTKIYELSYRNLVNVMDQSTINSFQKKYATVNYCEQHIVRQHDLLRQLAVNLNSKLPIAERPRLIISEHKDQLITNVQGSDKIASVEEIQEPMQARILSISTGESFSSRWCNMRVPEVEVMVMNINSKTYTLPHFMKEMLKVRILNVTNYGFYKTEFENFHLLGCLSNLTRIRLERVAMSSLSGSIFALVNLQKVSFIKCDMVSTFDDLCIDNLDVWPRLVEMEMEDCSGLMVYPHIFCNSVYLKKLSIRNCYDLFIISERFGRLTSLETLILCGCTRLVKLPKSITKLPNLSILDISDCWGLRELPQQMGSFGGQRTIYMNDETGVERQIVESLSNTKVVFNYRNLLRSSILRFINYRDFYPEKEELSKKSTK